MCCGNKCLFIIPVKTATIIFGCMNAFISGVGTIGSTGLYLMSIVFWMTHAETDSGAVNMMTFFMVEFTSSFVCSVLLLHGLTKNKLKLVMVYLIYGIIQIVLLLTFCIMLLCVGYFIPSVFFIAIVLLVFFGLWLRMVFISYRIITSELNESNAIVYPDIPQRSNPNVYSSS